MKSIISYIPHSIGPYLLDKEIGSGSFSVVYRAFLKKSKQMINTQNKFPEEEQLNDANDENNIKSNSPIQNNVNISKNQNIKKTIQFSRSKSFCSIKGNQKTKLSNDDSFNFTLNGDKNSFESEKKAINRPNNYLNDKYDILNENLSQSNDKNHYFAIKIFPKSNLESQSDEELFQREINAMAFFHHENIISLKDFLSDDYNFYLVMDYCEGLDLKQYITEKAPEGIDEKTAAVIFKQIVSAVSYCHSTGVAHRDLKPENILITSFPKIKISDFGLCGYITEDQLMRTFCGSPCYTAPECLSKIEYDGIRADTWSIGVILYTIVTGNAPWPINNSSIMLKNIIKGKYTIPKNISQSCRSLITGLLNINPKERLTLNQIMNHQWLNQNITKQNETEGNNDNGDEISDNFIDSIKQSYHLPTSKSMTLEEFSEASSKMNSHADHGIYYPFTYVTEQYINSSAQNDDSEEKNKVLSFHDEIPSDIKNDDNFSQSKSTESLSTDCDLFDLNSASHQQNQNSNFPVIKKQRKKPRRSDISSSIALFDPQGNTLINTSSDDQYCTSSIEKNQKIQIEKKRESPPEKRIKHPLLLPTGRKSKESNLGKVNVTYKRHQSQKILKFPKRSKSHLNFL